MIKRILVIVAICVFAIYIISEVADNSKSRTKLFYDPETVESLYEISFINRDPSILGPYGSVSTAEICDKANIRKFMELINSLELIEKEPKISLLYDVHEITFVYLGSKSGGTDGFTFSGGDRLKVYKNENYWDVKEYRIMNDDIFDGDIFEYVKNMQE